MNDLQTLTAQWLRAKADEAEANQRRADIELQMVALLPSEAAEGTVSQAVGDYKVAVSYKVTRKVDSDKLQAIWGDLPEAAHKAFRWKAEIDTKNYKALREFAPADYARIVPLLETKPSKPSVSIVLAEKQAA